MRVNMKKFLNQRIWVQGTIIATGLHLKNKSQLCINIKNVSEYYFGDKLCEHTWIRLGKNMLKNINELYRGDILCFNAKIVLYTKQNGFADYGLKTITKVRKIGRDTKLNNMLITTRNNEWKNISI